MLKGEGVIILAEFSQARITSFYSHRFYLVRENESGFFDVSTTDTHLT